MRRQIIKKALLYFASIAIFWNILVAFRAYRFSHFKNYQPQTITKNADIFGFAMSRISGQPYYKYPIVHTPAIPYKTVFLTTGNDLKLEGWYMEAAAAKGTVVLFHGFDGNKERVLQEAYAFNKMGYHTFLMDFRAHGNSEGYSCTLGKNEAEDVQLAYQYIAASGEKNIILWGSSMGAATIAYSIQKYPIKPAKVILEMPFASYAQLIEKFFQNSKYPTEPTSTLFTFWAGVFQGEWFFNMKPSNYVKSIKCPVLLQWGRNDDLVPASATNKIFNNITATKQIKVYENSGHESFCVKEPVLWNQTVAQFLNQ